MMAWEKRIYILMIEANKMFSFFSLQYFLKKKMKNMFSVFQSSYRNTRESLGKLEKAVKTNLRDRIDSLFGKSAVLDRKTKKLSENRRLKITDQ